MKPLRPCGQIGCSNLTNKTYCNDHSYILEGRNKERHKHYNKYKRDEQSQKFYNSREWKRTRLTRLQKDKYLCIRCKEDNKITHADMVDHIIPISVDWSKRLDVDNLQSLCNKCHAIKTADDKRRYG